MAAVLALNHEDRGENDLPPEGYLRQIREAASYTWQIIPGRAPNGAGQRTRTGDTTHLTIYNAPGIPPGLLDKYEGKLVGIRRQLVRGESLYRGVYLLLRTSINADILQAIDGRGYFSMEHLRTLSLIHI